MELSEAMAGLVTHAGNGALPASRPAAPVLALFGAAPAFPEALHVGRPNLGDREQLMARFNEILDRRWLTNGGACVQELERRLADYLGVKHCIAMCNATVALEIVIRAAGLKGEVIVPSFTFVATAHALQWQEITPVFADIDPRTHCLDPESVRRAITPRTTGIIGVHVWGQPCAVNELQQLAAEKNLTLLYDAAHAFACSHGDRMIGGNGTAEVFSFHATKFFNTFEGGAVTTNDDELARRIRLMKNFGFSGMDEVTYVGTNGKMTEVCAAMGLTGLDSLPLFVLRNRANHGAYQQGLAGLPGLRLLSYNEEERCNYQYVVVEIDPEFGLTRDQLVTVLWHENIRARCYFYPGCHRMEPYRTLFPNAGRTLPNTEALSRRVMVLPTGTAVDEADISRICGLIRTAHARAGEIRERLGEDCGIPAA